MLKLNDREWRSFRIYDVFNHVRGKRQTSASRKKGDIPYYSASGSNNGLTDFISNPLFVIKIDAIIYSTFGDAYYVTKNFSASDEITILTTKVLNRFNGLFIAMCINQNKSKYSFGRKAFSNKISKDKIMLPVKPNNSHKPDYEFMEEYIKNILLKKKRKYKEHINSVLKRLKYREIPSLKEKEWKEFSIEYLFNIVIGKNIDGNKVDKELGSVPYITRKETNNGLDGFINSDTDKLNSRFPVITIGNETACPFVQRYPFFTGTKVNILIPNAPMSEYVLFFIATCLRQQKPKYNYAFTANSTRLKKQTFLLPVDIEDNPDYEYMEQYIKNIMYKKYNNYLQLSCNSQTS